MIGPDKETKALKQSHLMQVAEFHTMVNALQRFKDDLAVKAITGKKNIRKQQTPDQIFFSVLEKMLLEVSRCHTDISIRKAEQQLLSLQKVHLWFQSNKQVLVRSDGYFQSARKITEEIHARQLKSRAGRKLGCGRNLKGRSSQSASLQNIDAHLEKLHQAEQDTESRIIMPSGSSMFAPSPTQDLTSVASATTNDMGYYQEDLDFAREIYEHEYTRGNPIERLNRPTTAPLKLTSSARSPSMKTGGRTSPSSNPPYSNQIPTRRPQSAISQIRHDLSWAKTSPLPLTVLLHNNANVVKDGDDASNKTKIMVKIPSEGSGDGLVVGKKKTDSKTNESQDPITDERRIANLVSFKKFCVEHATQQETSMRQYTHHKHGTRQHFLEFPENKTESAVRKTATDLYSTNKSSSSVEPDTTPRETYREMTLVDFLDRDVASSIHQPSGSVEKLTHDIKETELRKPKISAGSTKLSMTRGRPDSASSRSKPVPYNPSPCVSVKVPHPPLKQPHKVVQPCHDPVTMSSVVDLAFGAGKRMNSASEQALSAPKHGWRYPMVPIDAVNQKEPDKTKASGVVIALQDDDVVQHKVLIPLAPSNGNYQQVSHQALQTNLTDDAFPPLLDMGAGDYVRPKSSYTAVTGAGSSLPSRCSTRPMSSPRYVTEVRALYNRNVAGSRLSRGSKTDFDQSKFEANRRSLRSAGTPGGISRPKTAASWGSYPSRSEVSRSVGAASHSSTGVLRHRSVAETMKVKCVDKRMRRGTSGRSSASSYAAQLRERKRAGGAAFSQTKIAPKKKMDYEVAVGNEQDLHPHLSFVSIVSPLQVPSGLPHSSYARPGGVYCGSTAVVAVATEHPSNLMDDASDDGLSYEVYSMSGNEEMTEDESKPTDGGWLSQWLSGGPLDGLNEAGGDTGGPTTYADLVSRAAVINSSGDRSYSEDAPSSTGVAQIDVPSPREDFSISPRSDPLISHRTTTDEDYETRGSERLEEYKKQEVDSGEESYSDYQSSLSSHRSSEVSSASNQNDDSADAKEVDETVMQKEDPVKQKKSNHPQLKNLDSLLEEDEDNFEFDQSSETSQSLNDPQTERAGENDVMCSSEEAVERTGSPISTHESNNALNETSVRKEATSTGDDRHETSNNNRTDDITTDKPSLQNDVHIDNTVVCQNKNLNSDNEEMHKLEKVVRNERDAADDPDNVSSFVVKDSMAEDFVSEVHKQKATDEDLKTEDADCTTISIASREEESINGNKDQVIQGNSLLTEDEINETDGSAESGSDETNETSSYDSGSLTESETEILGGSSPVRIVITSARRVERELTQGTISSSDQNYPKTISDPIESNVVEDEEHVVERVVSQNVEDPSDTGLENDQIPHVSTDKNYENNNFDTSTNIITFEEVAAVTSLARPSSGRPIPSEAEVRDPFVDMVASTRQRQIDRNVDVQAIFKGSVAGDPYKEFDLEQRRIREEEQEAVVKMQRAYRQHLARTRAARKCSGISKESLEWARSYKTMLVEKRETRRRRLKESRHSARSLQRRDAKRLGRIGPHTEVYEIYHPGPELPDTELIQDSAVDIQRMVRGWLVRLKLENVKQLANKRGSTLVVVVNEYRKLLQRTQRRHGKLRPSLYLTYEELSSYLHQRAKFELVFKKREFWKEMESSELPAFFGDCDLFPSQDEINEAWDAVSKSMDYAPAKKKQSPTAMSLEDVLEVAFHIYVPTGARMEDQRTRSSTWMTPIYDGNEGLKLLSGNDYEQSEVESADLELVTKLVSQAFKDRKNK